jgi:hypothetical protein
MVPALESGVKAVLSILQQVAEEDEVEQTGYDTGL